jgi:hypothetical protein
MVDELRHQSGLEGCTKGTATSEKIVDERLEDQKEHNGRQRSKKFELQTRERPSGLRPQASRLSITRHGRSWSGQAVRPIRRV